MTNAQLDVKMNLPETYRVFRRTTGKPRLTIVPSTERLPRELGQTDVLIKINAVSLNFRDIAVLDGRYPAPALEGGIVASDAAAEVAAVGSAVKDFAIGDRVSVIFNLVGLTGSEDEPYQRMLSSEVDGVLRENAIYEDKYLVHLPEHLSWEEVSHNIPQTAHHEGDSADMGYPSGIYHHLRRRYGLECSRRPPVGL